MEIPPNLEKMLELHKVKLVNKYGDQWFKDAMSCKTPFVQLAKIIARLK